MIDRKAFFAGVRARPFGGSLTAGQVAGCEAIFDEWDRRGLTDLRWLAYMLATVFREAGPGMQPISENLNYSVDGLLKTFPKYFTPAQATAYARQPERIANRAYANRIGNGSEASGDGWRYRGRALVQLTGRANYANMGKLLGIRLEEQPDLALQPDVAVAIMFEGMTKGVSLRGDFTGVSLETYFTATTTDWFNARRIINGTDAAAEIAENAKLFYAALRVVPDQSGTPAAPEPPISAPPAPVEPPQAPPAPSKPPAPQTWLQALFAALATFFKRS